jgi:dTDP-4-dehydrorhamnose reductase
VTRWLVTGSGGMLGRDLVSTLIQCGHEVTGLSRSELDIADEAAVRGILARCQPAVVVNCAAWTAVDDAETHETEALRVNGQAVAGLAAACAAQDAALVQLSTDYVFDGQARRPYPEDATPAPRTAYGRTKLAGEQAVLRQPGLTGYVVRTAWLYGAHGRNFVATMIARARAGAVVQVVDDQYGQPTWTSDLAAQITTLIEAAGPPGIYHATSSGATTWFGVAQEVFRLLGANPDRVTPTGTAALARPAPRPAYSVLGHDAWRRAGLAPIGDWQLALRRAFPALLAAAASARASVNRPWLPRLRQAFLQLFGMGQARLIAGHDPGVPGLRQGRSRGVLGGQHRLQAVRPGDAQLRVERVYAVLAAGGVRSRAQVQHRSLVGQRHEGVPEALG